MTSLTMLNGDNMNERQYKCPSCGGEFPYFECLPGGGLGCPFCGTPKFGYGKTAAEIEGLKEVEKREIKAESEPEGSIELEPEG